MTIGRTALFGRGSSAENRRLADVLRKEMLGGIGFTVALLIGDLAFADPARRDHVKLGVLIGTTTAAVLAAVVLSVRDRAYAREAES